MRDTPKDPVATETASLFGTRIAKTIWASGQLRPQKQAGHMIATDPIKTSAQPLARRGPSTYGSSLARGWQTGV